MGAQCKCRYDAWGKKILPHQAMLLYYKDDQNSLDIVRRWMPHRYVCLPNVEIRIGTVGEGFVVVTLIYPGETIEKALEPSTRVLEALRRTYRNGKGWSHECKNGKVVIFRRSGRVIMDPARKYGIYL